MKFIQRRSLQALALAALTSCGSTSTSGGTGTGTNTSAGGQTGTQQGTDSATLASTDAHAEPVGTTTLPPEQRQRPPTPGAPRVVHFPSIARSSLANGLELDVVEYHTLPVVQLRLVVRHAGTATDPGNLPGLAGFTGDMLKEGTHAHTSAQIAEAIEFVGGTLDVVTTADSTTISSSVLKEHAETALTLINEIVTDPLFPQDEIDKLRRRETDRLTRSLQDPNWLAAREFYAALYGPGTQYGHFDTTAEALHRLTRNDLTAFHRARFTANQMFLAVVGDVHAAEFAQLAGRTLGHIRRASNLPVVTEGAPTANTRRVIIVDRPDSAQSVIRIGNTALQRSSEDYVPLEVANQVLGGEASSRLFMDLRERRSLTYGAYSRVLAQVANGVFYATGSVRTPVTGEAFAAFYEHLERIVREPASDAEIAEAEAFLTDSFALQIETPSDLVRLLVELRLYGLPDDYWDTFRTRIGQVTAAQALAAAQRYIQTAHNVGIIVGSAETFEHDAQHIGPVRVVNLAGQTLRELPFVPAQASTPAPAGDAGTGH